MKRSVVFATLLLVVGVPALAASKGDNIVRFGLAQLEPTSETEIPGFDKLFLDSQPSAVPGVLDATAFLGEVEADGATGGFVSYERMFTDRIGVEFGVTFATHDISADGRINSLTIDTTIPPPNQTTVNSVPVDGTVGEIDLQPIQLGVNFHFGGGERLDLYAGPFVSATQTGDLKLDDIGELDADGTFGFGGVFGLDVGLGEGRWSFSSALRYSLIEVEVKNPANPDPSRRVYDIEVDPITLQIGVSVRF